LLLNHLAVHENCDIIFDSFDDIPDDTDAQNQEVKYLFSLAHSLSLTH